MIRCRGRDQCEEGTAPESRRALILPMRPDPHDLAAEVESTLDVARSARSDGGNIRGKSALGRC